MTAARRAADDDDPSIAIAPESRALRELIDCVAPTPLPVLLLGETGSGKEIAAERLHRHSRQTQDRFVKVNCASLAESIVDSELFGHERGAFTNAHATREGLFESADGGTLFLDEVAALSSRTQAKLLRVLECGEIVRLGSSRARCVNVRIIAATHGDLEGMVASGAFREDLFFRLNTITVRIPPLRARPSDIVPLAELFAARLARSLDRVPPRFSRQAIELLIEHGWPGNVRELRHVVERAVVFCQTEIEAADLGLPICRPLARFDARASSNDVLSDEPAAALVDEPRAGPGCIRDEVKSFERERIVAALENSRQNQTRAAELLGVSRRTLTNKLNAYGILRPRKRGPSLGD